MNINVTQEHIDKGEVGDPGACPVALAMLDAGVENPLVGPSQIFYGPQSLSKPRGTIKPDHELKAFIVGFDTKEEVAPFSFVIPDDPAPEEETA